jgi:hypothetical protein
MEKHGRKIRGGMGKNRRDWKKRSGSHGKGIRVFSPVYVTL